MSCAPPALVLRSGAITSSVDATEDDDEYGSYLDAGSGVVRRILGEISKSDDKSAEVPVARRILNEEGDQEDLAADGPVARRILKEIATLPPLPDDRFVVAETVDGRGRGLYVADVPIAANTYLFDYRGELIDQTAFEARYEGPEGPRSEYAISILLPDERSVYIDARDPRVSNVARFMNHAEATPGRNCECWTLSPPTTSKVRALLFASRDLAVGEELCWDYGEKYWEGRNDKLEEASRRSWWNPSWVPWAT